MKRILSFISAAAMLAACTADRTADVAGVGYDTLNVSFEEGSRIHLDESLQSAWNAGDLVTVYNFSDAGECWQFDGNTGDRSGTLSRSGEPATAGSAIDRVIVVYPYKADYVFSAADKTLVTTLPATQHYAKGSYGAGENMMVATGTDQNVMLRNVFGWLRLELRGNATVRQISFAGNNSESLCGTATVDCGTLGLTLAGDGGTTVTLDCGDAGVKLSETEATAFYIALAPQTFTKGFTVKVTDTDGSTLTKSTAREIVISRNCIKPFSELTCGDNNGISTALVRATDSTLAVAWTVTPANADKIGTTLTSAGGADYTVDITKKYKVELYKDAACRELIVGWTLNDPDSSTSVVKSTVKFTSVYPPRFIFSGLEPSTDYYLMVRNLTDDTAMNYPAKVSTKAPVYTGTVVSGTPKTGDVILFENFDKLIWGSDLTTGSSGYSRNDRGSVTTLLKASGDNPDAEDTQIYTVLDAEIGLFNTLKNTIDDMGLSQWGWIADDNKTGCILNRPGYIKVGASSKHASLITPVLSNISGIASVKVTFNACPYGSPSATGIDVEKPIAVKVFDNTTMASGNRISEYTVGDVSELTLEGDQSTWREYSVTLNGVTSASRIAFSGNRSGTGVQSRFMIDDIRIEVVESVELTSFKGSIKDTSGNPIAGVSVTDGYNVTKSGADGSFELPYNSKAEFIYYSAPAEYELNYNAKGYPLFYAAVSPSTASYDFTLAPLSGGKQTKWTLCCMADPQVLSTNTMNRFRDEIAPDIKATMSKYSNVYGMSLGDQQWNSAEWVWNTMNRTMDYATTGVHFFSVMGNHDWYTSSSSEASDALQKNLYGPTRYSFNRGDVHVVGMNNVIASKGQENYVGGFTADEYNWLVRDLANVPTDKMVILCVHIPFRTGNNSQHRKAHYYQETLNLLAKYQKAYILAGHSHYVYQNFHSVNGKTIHEITHAAACGMFWNLKGCGCGAPSGYAIYEFDGNTMVNNTAKSAGYDKSFQIRAYDGSEKINGDLMHPYSWGYEKGWIVANIFNANKNWTIELWQDGSKVCTMSNMTSSNSGTYTVDYLKDDIKNINDGSATFTNNRDWWAWYQMVDQHPEKSDRDGKQWWGRRADSSYQKVSYHLYRGKLRTTPSGDISTANFEIRATDPYGNVYTCSKITKYTEMDLWR